MRVLWFSVTPSLFNPHSNSHNGGGWIASLEQIVKSEDSVQLGVAFNFSDGQFRYVKDGVTYYPILQQKKSIIDKMLKKDFRQAQLDQYLQIINDFKPDIIQIFGSENDFGVICGNTDIPVVIHMQGCLPPYHNALFPVGMNTMDFLIHRGLNLRYRFIGLRSESSFRRNAEREIRTIQHCKYFMGRTEWDKGLISLFNPDAEYFHCEEALRPSFLHSETQWKWHDDKKKTFISIISRPWYKGSDLILKTAELLRRFTDLDFEWKVYGIQEMRFFESKYGIKAAEVNVKVMGTASSDELVNEICKSSCYVHTSYIDNSPNSLCEAQIMGAPVLATHVGGISSMVKDGTTGILFPANAPYTLATLMKRIATERNLAESLSKEARQQALQRHNPEQIRRTLVDIYNYIVNENH